MKNKHSSGKNLVLKEHVLLTISFSKQSHSRLVQVKNIDRFGFITQTKPKYRQLVFHKIAKTKLTNIDLKAQL